ncbi:MAG: Hsp20/alpha crystallin family protein [Deltaproteobacteria bacterium]|nr:MAG: Hsp20/alpha crystallin family protein [Deltaproteobacteria bacterium]
MFGNYWNDLDRTFAALDELRRRLETPWFHSAWSNGGTAYPRLSLEDNGAAFVVTADVPGMAAEDLDIKLDRDTLTIRGERKVSPPEGYSVHRQERGNLAFSRSFTLPAHVNAEKVSATVHDGVLSITLEKAPEAKPRQIAVTSA